MPKVKVNDIEMYYEVHGDGIPLVIINGYGGTSEGWEAVSPLISDLSRHYKVITQDNRGVGRSTISDKPVSIKLMAHDIATLLDRLDAESAYIIGNSMGGMIAQELAINNPEKVLGLVLSATSPGGECFMDEAQLEKLNMLTWSFDPPENMTGEDMMDQIVDVVWSPAFYNKNSERLNSYIPEYPAPPSTLKRHFEAIMRYDTCDRLSGIKARTLVLHGKQDGLILPASALYMVKRIPDSILLMIDEARHGVLEEKWGEVYPRLVSFIGDM